MVGCPKDAGTIPPLTKRTQRITNEAARSKPLSRPVSISLLLFSRPGPRQSRSRFLVSLSSALAPASALTRRKLSPSTSASPAPRLRCNPTLFWAKRPYPSCSSISIARLSTSPLGAAPSLRVQPNLAALSAKSSASGFCNASAEVIEIVSSAVLDAAQDVTPYVGSACA